MRRGGKYHVDALVSQRLLCLHQKKQLLVQQLAHGFIHAGYIKINVTALPRVIRAGTKNHQSSLRPKNLGSDAFHLPELYWLAGRWGKRYLSKALAVYVQEKILTRDEALEGARMILYKNNRRTYNLPA